MAAIFDPNVLITVGLIGLILAAMVAMDSVLYPDPYFPVRRHYRDAIGLVACLLLIWLVVGLYRLAGV